MKKEIKELTGLRGLAALTVAIAHYNFSNLSSIATVFWWHNAAVDLFFCLSGFTLCLAYGAGRSTKFNLRDYVVARFARIYPLYIITILFMGAYIINPYVVGSEKYPQAYAAFDFIKQILMINSWPVIGNGVHWNAPSWSISVEIFCYVFFFPAIFYSFALIQKMNEKVLSLLLLALSGASALIFLFGNDSNIYSAAVYKAKNEFAYWVPVLRGLAGFLVGGIIYASYIKNDSIASGTKKYCDVIVAAIVFLLICAYYNFVSVHMVAVMMPLLVLGVAGGGSVFSQAMSSRPMAFLGNISYSVYMVHMPLYFFFSLSFPNLRDGRPYIYAASITLALIFLSTATFYLVELPSKKLIRFVFFSRARKPVSAEIQSGLSAITAGAPNAEAASKS